MRTIERAARSGERMAAGRPGKDSTPPVLSEEEWIARETALQERVQGRSSIPTSELTEHLEAWPAGTKLSKGTHGFGVVGGLVAEVRSGEVVRPEGFTLTGLALDDQLRPAIRYRVTYFQDQRGRLGRAAPTAEVAPWVFTDSANGGWDSDFRTYQLRDWRSGFKLDLKPLYPERIVVIPLPPSEITDPELLTQYGTALEKLGFESVNHVAGGKLSQGDWEIILSYHDYAALDAARPVWEKKTKRDPTDLLNAHDRLWPDKPTGIGVYQLTAKRDKLKILARRTAGEATGEIPREDATSHPISLGGQDWPLRSAQIELKKAQSSAKLNDTGVEWQIQVSRTDPQRYVVRGRDTKPQRVVDPHHPDMDGAVIDAVHVENAAAEKLTPKTISRALAGRGVESPKDLQRWSVSQIADVLEVDESAVGRIFPWYTASAVRPEAPTHVTVTAPPVDRKHAALDDLLADYKARGLDARSAYNALIQDRSLAPDVGLKDLIARYEHVSPRRLGGAPQVVAFEATHLDTFTDQRVQVSKNAGGWWEIVWEKGMTGTEPPGALPDRYRLLGIDVAYASTVQSYYADRPAAEEALRELGWVETARSGSPRDVTRIEVFNKLTGDTGYLTPANDGKGGWQFTGPTGWRERVASKRYAAGGTPPESQKVEAEQPSMPVLQPPESYPEEWAKRWKGIPLPDHVEGSKAAKDTDKAINDSIYFTTYQLFGGIIPLGTWFPVLLKLGESFRKVEVLYPRSAAGLPRVRYPSTYKFGDEHKPCWMLFRQKKDQSWVPEDPPWIDRKPDDLFWGAPVPAPGAAPVTPPPTQTSSVPGDEPEDPKFAEGDVVVDIEVPNRRGTVERYVGYDSSLGSHQYKVRENGQLVTWNEMSMRSADEEAEEVVAEDPGDFDESEWSMAFHDHLIGIYTRAVQKSEEPDIENMVDDAEARTAATSVKQYAAAGWHLYGAVETCRWLVARKRVRADMTTADVLDLTSSTLPKPISEVPTITTPIKDVIAWFDTQLPASYRRPAGGAQTLDHNAKKWTLTLPSAFGGPTLTLSQLVTERGINGTAELRKLILSDEVWKAIWEWRLKPLSLVLTRPMTQKDEDKAKAVNRVTDTVIEEAQKTIGKHLRHARVLMPFGLEFGGSVHDRDLDEIRETLEAVQTEVRIPGDLEEPISKEERDDLDEVFRPYEEEFEHLRQEFYRATGEDVGPMNPDADGADTDPDFIAFMDPKHVGLARRAPELPQPVPSLFGSPSRPQEPDEDGDDVPWLQTTDRTGEHTWTWAASNGTYTIREIINRDYTGYGTKRYRATLQKNNGALVFLGYQGRVTPEPTDLPTLLNAQGTCERYEEEHPAPASAPAAPVKPLSHADEQRARHLYLQWMLNTGPSFHVTAPPEIVANAGTPTTQGLRWTLLRVRNQIRPLVTDGRVVLPGLFRSTERAIDRLAGTTRHDRLLTAYEQLLIGGADYAGEYMAPDLVEDKLGPVLYGIGMENYEGGFQPHEFKRVEAKGTVPYVRHEVLNRDTVYNERLFRAVLDTLGNGTRVFLPRGENSPLPLLFRDDQGVCAMLMPTRAAEVGARTPGLPVPPPSPTTETGADDVNWLEGVGPDGQRTWTWTTPHGTYKVQEIEVHGGGRSAMFYRPTLQELDGRVVNIGPVAGTPARKPDDSAILESAQFSCREHETELRARSSRKGTIDIPPLPEPRTWESAKGTRTITGWHEVGKTVLVKTPPSTSSVILPVGELPRERDFDARNLASRQKMQAEEDARKAAEAAEAERVHAELEGFTDGMAPMVAGRVVKTLDVTMNFNGAFMTRKARIRQLVIEHGAHIGKWAGQRILEWTEGGQTAHLDEGQLTKTGLDFAAHLIARRGTPVAASTPSTHSPTLLLSEPQKQLLTRVVTGKKVNAAQAAEALDLLGARLDAGSGEQGPTITTAEGATFELVSESRNWTRWPPDGEDVFKLKYDPKLHVPAHLTVPDDRWKYIEARDEEKKAEIRRRRTQIALWKKQAEALVDGTTTDGLSVTERELLTKFAKGQEIPAKGTAQVLALLGFSGKPEDIAQVHTDRNLKDSAWLAQHKKDQQENARRDEIRTRLREQARERVGMKPVDPDRPVYHRNALTDFTIRTCQCCWRDIKVHPDPTYGPIMVLHGYERPGDGHTHGNCPGVDLPPYEKSCVAVREEAAARLTYSNNLLMALRRHVYRTPKLRWDTGRTEEVEETGPDGRPRKGKRPIMEDIEPGHRAYAAQHRYVQRELVMQIERLWHPRFNSIPWLRYAVEVWKLWPDDQPMRGAPDEVPPDRWEVLAEDSPMDEVERLAAVPFDPQVARFRLWLLDTTRGPRGAVFRQMANAQPEQLDRVIRRLVDKE